MTFHRNDSKAEHDVERYYSLTTCPGDAPALRVPNHWHKHHDEYMSCEEGQIELYLDGKTIVAKPGDPVVFIERRRVHGFKFPEGQRTVLKERTRPTGEFKQRFFEDIFRQDGGFWGAMRGFADGDTFLALPGPFRWVDEVYGFVIWLLVRLLYPRRGPVPQSVAPLVVDGSNKKGL